jgi:hypothetical protein
MHNLLIISEEFSLAAQVKLGRLLEDLILSLRLQAERVLPVHGPDSVPIG